MSDWRDNEKKTCSVCGETYWPNPRESMKQWSTRKACGKICGGIYANQPTKHATK